MNDFFPQDELAQLRLEVESLRLANRAIQEQMNQDAAWADSMLRAMEQQAEALRKANLRQRGQADFTQRVMDSTSALMIVLDEVGHIRQVNRRFREGLGVPGDGVSAHVLDNWLPPEEQAALAERLGKRPWPVQSALFELTRALGGYGAEHRLRASDGGYIDVWIEASPQTDPQGKEEGAVVCATDITVLKRQRDALAASEGQLREAQSIAQLGSWAIEMPSGKVLYWSDELLRICELARPPGICTDVQSLVHPEDRAALERDFYEAVEQKSLFSHPCRLHFADGRVKWVEFRGVLREGDGVSPRHVAGTMLDITPQRQADEQMRLAARVFESSLNGVIITDAQTRIIKANLAVTRILGYTPEELIGKTTASLRSNQHDLTFYRQLWRELRNHGEWQGEIWDRRKDGEITPLWQSISTVRDARGEIVNYIGTFYDLSEQKRAAAHIHRLAYYDALTGLPNRQSFNESCEQALQQAHQNDKMLALLFLDLDRFKYVNDTLGHPVGDELLRSISQRLKQVLRNSDVIARLGGDEFIVLAPGINTPDDVARIAKKILAVLAKPFLVAGHRLEIRASVGISCYPEDGHDAATLIKHADLALYKAKEEGRDQFRFYEAHLTARARERLFLETELRAAIEQGGLCLHYQPQVDLSSRRLVGAEALARWRHPKHGSIPPAKFIAIAEESGLIAPLGEWVLREACRQAEAWRQAGLGPHRIAVNISGLQLERADFVATVAGILAETGLPPEWLELEITETCVMRRPERSVRMLESLRALGVVLAIDDFGTGQSSLTYLKRLPVQTLKIDRSFITDLPAGENEAAIARAIVALGHSLQLLVLAEGIETPAQEAFLRSLGCNRGQGYFYGRPVEAKYFEQILRNGCLPYTRNHLPAPHPQKSKMDKKLQPDK